MSQTIKQEKSKTEEVGLLTIVAVIIGGFGAAFGIMAASFSFIRDGEMHWATLLTSVLCLVVAASVYMVERAKR